MARRERKEKREVIEQCKRHAFWWTPEFVSVELYVLKVQKYGKTRKGLKIFESDS